MGATGALRLDPPPPLGEAAQVIDGSGRRFGIGPTHHWRTQGPVAQALLLTWVEPQALPGLVCSYALDAEASDGWREVVAVKDNHTRFRVHACAPFTTRRLPLCVAEVHGVGAVA